MIETQGSSMTSAHYARMGQGHHDGRTSCWASENDLGRAQARTVATRRGSGCARCCWTGRSTAWI